MGFNSGFKGLKCALQNNERTGLEKAAMNRRLRQKAKEVVEW